MNATMRLRPQDWRVRAIGIVVVIVLTALYLAFRLPEPIKASTLCQYQGWIGYENANQTGDSFKVCSPTLLPVSANRPNLHVNPGTLYLTGGGCAGALGNRNDWGDCISAVETINLASGYRLIVYGNINYSTAIFCTDTPGTHSYSLSGAPNDLASSARIVTGSC